LQVLAIMKRTGRRLSDLAGCMRPAPQRLINVDVRHKPPLEGIAPLAEKIRAAETELGQRGRVLVRYSGTQLICRVMVEGPTEAVTNRLAEDLAGVVRSALG
jgi:phosphoglucosamine mutase